MGDSWAVEWRPLLPLPAAAGPRAWAVPHPAHGASKQVEMVSFGVDPQWGGLLFSLCSRHEDAGAVLGAGGGVIFPNILADPLAASSAVPGAGGDLVNVLGSGYLDMHSVSVSSVWAIIVETAKATGMVVLLGVGSLLFYRVFHSIRSRLHGLKVGPASGRRVSAPRSLTSSGEDSDGESSEDEAAAAVRGFETLAEDAEITGMYFGPGADSSMDGSTTSLTRARACFAGLYSLTRITSSPSLDLDQVDLADQDLSDWDQGLSFPGRALPPTVSEEPLTSLEWDEEDMSYPDPALEDSGLANDLVLGACAANISPVHNRTKTEGYQKRQLSLDASLRDSDSMLTSSMATFELDADSEVGDPSAPIPDLDQEDEETSPKEAIMSRDNLHLPLAEVNPDINPVSAMSPISPESWLQSEGALTHSSSSSGVSVLSRSLSGLSDAWSSSAAITPATPASTIPIAIGQRVSIQEYVKREWQGDTKKAQTIVKGYCEIPGILGLNAIRVVRGDNYCAVRGTIFQALARGLPLPSGQAAASRCSELLTNSAGHWLRSWNFAGRLPYAGENVENGIRDCLLSIDSTIERLQLASDKESALANMLNADPWLDARLCEAAKLLMLVGALELRNAADQGAPLPLFAELLFARDTSSTPCDLMNNHLKNVGDTAGLEQVEMFLLGYSLGIRIRVVRPSAFGSQDYVCSYPNPEDIGVDMSEGVDNRRLVDLLAEDDRHYNILIA